MELECKVTGQPMPSVKWSKDGRPLMEDARFEWENKPEQGHYRLRIREANQHDEGTYRCVATNEVCSLQLPLHVIQTFLMY
jgi:hypothetical protein